MQQKSKLQLLQVQKQEHDNHDEKVGATLLELLNGGSVRSFLATADVATLSSEFKKNPERFYVHQALNNFGIKISSKFGSFKSGYQDGWPGAEFIDSKMKDIPSYQGAYSEGDCQISNKMLNTTPRKFIEDINTSIRQGHSTLEKVDQTINEYGALDARSIRVLLPIYIAMRKKGYSDRDLTR